MWDMLLFRFQEHSLDMCTAHLEYASQLGLLLQFAAHGLWPVYNQLCAPSRTCCTPTDCKAGLKMYDQKKSTHCCSEGETQLLLNMMKDLYINRFLDMCRYHNADLFLWGTGGKLWQNPVLMQRGKMTWAAPAVSLFCFDVICLGTIIWICTSACEQEY